MCRSPGWPLGCGTFTQQPRGGNDASLGFNPSAKHHRGATSGLPPTCGQDCECESRALAPTDPRARRWAWWLTGATIGWSSLEAVIAMVGGILASSVAPLWV